MRNRLCSGTIILSIILTASISALETDVTGQISGWTTETNIQDVWHNQTGVRYLPQLTLSQIVNDEMFWDLDTALNGFAVAWVVAS